MSAAAASSSSSSSSSTRVASHAGSWYEDDASALSAQFNSWLDAVKSLSIDHHTTRLKAIISPHAGYSYSGPTAAHGFKHIQQPDEVKRIFILGPSHHHYTSICELSKHSLYATPLSPLTLDHSTITSLRSTRCFSDMSLKVDEAEHSIEMQLPFIAHMMSKATKPFTIVPILVGNLSVQGEKDFAKVLLPYFSDPATLFVISSDFCHWGSRFSYTYRDNLGGEYWESIERLDKKGMELIEKQDADGFANYLETFSNTICGRHPIGVLMRMLEASSASGGGGGGGGAKQPFTVKMLHYAQSSKAKKLSDSSVSYVSAIVSQPR